MTDHVDMSALPTGDTEVPAGFIPFPYNAGFMAAIGPIYIRPATAVANGSDLPPAMGFRVLEQHLNPVGICHGGMMMSLIDMAIGQAVLHHVERRIFPPSINNSYDFLKPAPLGDWLQSRIDFVHTTPRTGFANGFLDGPDGPVMRCNGICKLLKDGDSRFARKLDL